MRFRTSWTDRQNWSYIFGIYRFGDSVTLCFVFFSVTVTDE